MPPRKRQRAGKEPATGRKFRRKDALPLPAEPPAAAGGTRRKAGTAKERTQDMGCLVNWDGQAPVSAKVASVSPDGCVVQWSSTHAGSAVPPPFCPLAFCQTLGIPLAAKATAVSPQPAGCIIDWSAAAPVQAKAAAPAKGGCLINW